MEPLLALVVTFGLMWVLLIRPQQRRMRQHQSVVASLEPGDEVVTAGGIYGVVQSVEDDSMTLLVAPGVELKVLRAAVSQRVDPDVEDDEDEDEYEETDTEDDDEGVDEDVDADALDGTAREDQRQGDDR